MQLNHEWMRPPPSRRERAVEAGASAVLLIVAALGAGELAQYLALAQHYCIEALVEIHTESEAEVALGLGATLIGINQRDLHSFEVDSSRAESLIATLPASVVVVAESGFTRREAVARAAQVGFDAVLVGEQFVTAFNIADEVRSFGGFPRGAR